MTAINYYIQRLANYAVKNNLIIKEDEIWAVNLILAELKLNGFEPAKIKEPLPRYPGVILAAISNWAAENKIIEDNAAAREMLETKITGILTRRPSDFVGRDNQGVRRTPHFQRIKSIWDICFLSDPPRRVLLK